MLFDLHLAALVLYGLSAAIALAPFAGLPAVSRRWTLGVAIVGAAVHGFGVAELMVMGIGGLAGPLSVLAWFLVLLQIGSELLLRVGTVTLFTAPLAGGLVAVVPADVGTVIDVGSGTGHYAAAALEARPGARGLGIDLSVAACRRAARAHVDGHDLSVSGSRSQRQR